MKIGKRAIFSINELRAFNTPQNTLVKSQSSLVIPSESFLNFLGVAAGLDWSSSSALVSVISLSPGPPIWCSLAYVISDVNDGMSPNIPNETGVKRSSVIKLMKIVFFMMY